MKKIIVAKLTAGDKEYSGKREAELYDGNDQKTQDANVGATLRVQREIRDALKVKYGLKVATSGGVAKSYADIDEV
jgi:hypothetical protein